MVLSSFYAYGLLLILWDIRGAGIAIRLELEEPHKSEVTEKTLPFSKCFLKMSLPLRNPWSEREDR